MLCHSLFLSLFPGVPLSSSRRRYAFTVVSRPGEHGRPSVQRAFPVLQRGRGKPGPAGEQERVVRRERPPTPMSSFHAPESRGSLGGRCGPELHVSGAALSVREWMTGHDSNSKYRCPASYGCPSDLGL
jgi:hypothetical protein